MPPSYADAPEFRALFAGVLGAPDEDAPRLVLADWLEENGVTERAEFIRLQIELARLPHRDPRRQELKARERDLLEAHDKEWCVPIKSFKNAHFSPEFRRGFQDEVTCSHWKAFHTQADALFAAAPLRGLHVEKLPPRNVKALAQSPLLARLRALRLRPGFGDEELSGLVNSPHVASLKELELTGSSEGTIGHAGARALAESPHLTNLTSLQLSSLEIGDEGVTALAQSPILANLTRLDLDSCHFGADGVVALASATLGPLTELYLSWNRIGPAATGLLSRPVLADLETLFLRDCAVGPEGARAVAEARHLTALQHLWLDCNAIGPEGAADLAGASHLASLRGLNLGRNDLGDDGVAALAASPYLANLVFLGLHENRLGPAGVAALASSPYLARVSNLWLGKADVDEAGKAELRKRYRDRVSFQYP
jgi:uncharacterized protein (TIGR02996 family)